MAWLSRSVGRSDLTLHTRLAFFVLLLFLPAIGISAYFLNYFGYSEQSRLRQRALDAAIDIRQNVDRDIENLIVVLDTMALSLLLDEGRHEDFHRYARRALKAGGAQLILVDRSLQQILNTRFPFGTELPRAIDPDTVNAVLESRRPRISNLFYDTITRRMVYDVLVPVLRDGEARYVLRATQDAARLTELLQSPGLSPAWILGVADRTDTIVARSRDQDAFVGKRLTDGSIRASTGNFGVHRVTSLEGVEVWRAYARSALSGWLFGVFVPVAVVDAPLRQTWWFFLLAVSALFSLSLLFALLFARSILRPIAALRESARALGRGDVVPPLRSSLREANEVAEALHNASLERQRSEARLRFLMREISHRTKNVLAVTQAIARQTGIKSKTLAEFQQRFAGRLQGLGESVNLLIQGNWHAVELIDLVRTQLAPYAEPGGGRLRVTGERVAIVAQAAEQIGIVFHELATNASKYGALSVPDGLVTVHWERLPADDGRLRISWRESGGPPVVEPSEHGFGRMVIETAVPTALEADVMVEYARGGFRWRMDLPRRYLIETADTTMPAINAA